MKVLQVAPRFYPYIGGVENYVYCLSRELIKLGQEVKVICAREPAVGDESVEGVEVKRLRYTGKIANTALTLGLAKEVFFADCDIIHAHLPDPWSASLAAFVAAIRKKPLILTYHNDIVGKGICGYFAKTYNLIFLPLLLKLTKKILITHKEYLDYSPYLKGYARKIEVFPPGVDLDAFKLPIKKVNDEKTILFLGLLDEFHRYKGLDYLIRAMTLIKKEIARVKLIVGGEGVLKNYYKELAYSLGLDREIEFVGFISQEKLSDFYTQGDIFVLPSLSCTQEGFGIVLLEAMAAAKPVITTDIVGTARKIKEAMAGRVVKPADEKALATAIIEILRDETLATIMGQNGQGLVREHYDWRIIAKGFLELYKQCTIEVN